MHPELLRSASSCDWASRFGPAFSSSARSKGAGMRAATAARSKLTARAAHGETRPSRVRILRFVIQRFIQPLQIERTDPSDSFCFKTGNARLQKLKIVLCRNRCRESLAPETKQLRRP